VSARIEVRAALAHDLKSPLAVITGFAELLARREDPALRTEASARIAEAAERLGEAIDDALALLARERHPRSRRRQRVVLVGHDPFVLTLTAFLIAENVVVIAPPSPGPQPHPRRPPPLRPAKDK